MCRTKRQGWDDWLLLHLSGMCTRLVLALTLHQLGGSGSSILSPAGGLWAAGLSFIGLLGLVSGRNPTALCRPLSVAVACVMCWCVVW